MQRAVQLSASYDDDFIGKCFFTDSKPKPPPPSENEVLVRLKCRPVNPSDLMALRGKYRNYKPKEWPATPGFEGMGEVAEVGEKVTWVKVGQRVVPLIGPRAFTGNGSWQEYITVPATNIVPVPDEVSDEAAAQFIVNPWTIVGLLDELQVPPGEYLLQTAAGSSLGRQLAQYARSQGVRTINVVRREEHRRELKESGGDEVINYKEEDLVARVMEITGGKGVYAAVDAVAGHTTKLVSQCVRDHGTVLVYGALESEETVVGAPDLLFRDVQVHGFYLSNWLDKTHGQPEQKFSFARQVMKLLAEGVMVPKVGKKFDLAEFKAAIMHSLKAGQEGKVFLIG